MWILESKMEHELIYQKGKDCVGFGELMLNEVEKHMVEIVLYTNSVLPNGLNYYSIEISIYVKCCFSNLSKLRQTENPHSFYIWASCPNERMLGIICNSHFFSHTL